MIRVKAKNERVNITILVSHLLWANKIDIFWVIRLCMSPLNEIIKRNVKVMYDGSAAGFSESHKIG